MSDEKSMNTKEDLERINKHCHNMPSFFVTPLIEWINIIAGRLDEYKAIIDEKDKIIKRLVENIETED